MKRKENFISERKIRKIRLNTLRLMERSKKSEKQKGLYECKVDEAKAYEVEVKAKDLAGNEQISRIGFQIEQEKNIITEDNRACKEIYFLWK